MVQTILDVDEKLLSLAEQQARRDGKSLGALVEDALRAALHAPPAMPPASDNAADSAEADDAFFTALEEIRELGRLPASHRQVSLP